jgi:hypothetical protein
LNICEKQQDTLGQIIKQIQNAKELNITSVLDKIQEYRRNWLQHIYRMPRNRLPRIIKKLKTKRQ